MTNNTVPHSNETMLLQKKYDQARGNLMLMIVFTVINIALLISGAGVMFLFSATMPYWFSAFAFYFGLTEYYVYAGIIIFLYLLCWFFSKKHVAWLIGALVMFAVDIVYLIYVTIDMGEVSSIIDVLIHIWVTYYLITGTYYGLRLKKLAKSTQPDSAFVDSLTSDIVDNSAPLRLAEDVKHRVFVETDYNNHKICYRRAKSTNELVIDGYVYGEYKKLIEFAHCLSATVDGLDISVGYDGVYHSYIKVNGVEVAKKIRLY